MRVFFRVCSVAFVLVAALAWYFLAYDVATARWTDLLLDAVFCAVATFFAWDAVKRARRLR